MRYLWILIASMFPLLGYGDALSQRRQLIMGELEYYLQRHNVVDEGFDMVARFAKEGDSTLTAYMPHGNLVLTNAFAILKRLRPFSC